MTKRRVLLIAGHILKYRPVGIFWAIMIVDFCAIANMWWAILTIIGSGLILFAVVSIITITWDIGQKLIDKHREVK